MSWGRCIWGCELFPWLVSPPALPSLSPPAPLPLRVSPLPWQRAPLRSYLHNKKYHAPKLNPRTVVEQVHSSAASPACESATLSRLPFESFQSTSTSRGHWVPAKVEHLVNCMTQLSSCLVGTPGYSNAWMGMGMRNRTRPSIAGRMLPHGILRSNTRTLSDDKLSPL